MNILYEDDEILALDKPAGVLVHGFPAGRRRPQVEKGTIVAWLRKHRPEITGVGDDRDERPGIVHRLDKDTSGVLLVAKTQAAFLQLKKLFQNREMEKTYLAVVSGWPEPEKGTIEKPIGIVDGSVKRSVHATKFLKPARTSYEVVRRLALPDGGRAALLRVSPKTGRTHQIRVHLASINHPILGDALYGGRRGAKGAAPRLLLHASAIVFSPDSGRRLEIEAPLPPDFKDFLASAGETAEI
ncbi:MAG: RluA family pseudouridine synthase [Patescibacteria group bacterium]